MPAKKKKEEVTGNKIDNLMLSKTYLLSVMVFFIMMALAFAAIYKGDIKQAVAMMFSGAFLATIFDYILRNYDR